MGQQFLSQIKIAGAVGRAQKFGGTHTMSDMEHHKADHLISWNPNQTVQNSN